MDYAELFHRNPTVNPRTGRTISVNGVIYCKLVREFGNPDQRNLSMFNRYKDLLNVANNLEYPPYARLSWMITRLQKITRLSFKDSMDRYYIPFMSLDSLCYPIKHFILTIHQNNGTVYYQHNINWVLEIEKLRMYIHDVERATTLTKTKIILVEAAINLCE